MEVYLNPVKYCKTPTGHPKGHPCCKIADYDDTAFGAGTLTVHPWRAGPDCGKFIYNWRLISEKNPTYTFILIWKFFLPTCYLQLHDY